MLKVQNISFAYQTAPVIKNVSFTINKGQHIALVGASGCGKSTLLKIIYGLLQVAEGRLYWDDNEILGPNYHLVPGEEYMKYLSQGFELTAYRTVSENIGQYLSNFEPELKKGRVKELLEIVELEEFAATKVENLSGGQKQRVALARALAKKPELLLLDEPFGNIDNFRRSSLRRNLFNYLKRNKITSITATHDKTDILSFTDETIVIQKGEVIAHKNTIELYRHPKNLYIASLFGEINNIVISDLITSADHSSALVYPHEITIVSKSSISVLVRKSYFKGNHFLIESVLNGTSILFIEHHTFLPPGEKIYITIPEDLLLSRAAT
ncbi:ABC transporter ATP-binding protein [Aquimarina hainanensis]|uniref:ABC transporter ATP-binding protein n=1 Tax=Aquimarina hainanensis TaxID=1578017 RepID=A0ABW5N1A6_9FLAO